MNPAGNMTKETGSPISLKRVKGILKGVFEHPVVAVLWGHLNYLPYSGILLGKFAERRGVSKDTVLYIRAAATCSLLPNAPNSLQKLWPEMDPLELERYLHSARKPKISILQLVGTEFSKRSPFTETGFQLDPHPLLENPSHTFIFPLSTVRRNTPENNEFNKIA